MPSSTLTSYSPADGTLVGEVAMTPVDAIDGLVGRSRRALSSWQTLPITDRMSMLEVGGDELAERATEIGELLSREMGKPRRAAIGEVRRCGVGMASKVSEIAAALEPETLEGGGRRSVIHHDPLGVCAVITPWNYPVSMIHWLVIPALVAGNTVVLKPSEETPVVGQAYAEVLAANLPPDVLQVAHGADAQGRALVASGVDLVAFTGSRTAGKYIMASAAGGLKRLILELGGKDPLIVLEGADLEGAVDFAATNSFDNSGQACISTERIFVHDSLASDFESRLADKAREVHVGDPATDPDLGPMVNKRQRDHVLGQVHDAIEKGARIVGEAPRSRGLFLWPVVLADVADCMEIARKETFGPVACVSRFDDIEPVVERVNAAPHGLGAVVFGPEAEAASVARRLNAGMVGVNRGVFGVPGSPWVGAKESGYGFHGSRDGHRQFTQTRVITSGL